MRFQLPIPIVTPVGGCAFWRKLGKGEQNIALVHTPPAEVGDPTAGGGKGRIKIFKFRNMHD